MTETKIPEGMRKCPAAHCDKGEIRNADGKGLGECLYCHGEGYVPE